MRGNPPSGQTFELYVLLLIFWGGRKIGQKCKSILLIKLWPVVWLDCKGLKI